MTIFYFTATGNSLALAKRIGGTLVSIPQVIDSETTHYKDEAIGLIFPVYSWTLPKMVRRFLDKTVLEADYSFAIGTYGSISGGAMAVLQKRFDYTNRLLMLDNFLPIFEVGAQIASLPRKKIDENTAKIIADINSRKHSHVKQNLGLKAMTAVMGGMFKPAKNAQKYLCNDNCNQCGVCAKVCPSGNIEVKERLHFAGRCEGCLACQHLCPQNALHLKNEKSAKRWRHPEVSLAEIIEANDRSPNRT